MTGCQAEIIVEEEIIVDRDLQVSENCMLVGSRNCLNFVNTFDKLVNVKAAINIR